MELDYFSRCCLYLLLYLNLLQARSISPNDHCTQLIETLECNEHFAEDIEFPFSVKKLKLTNLSAKTLDFNVIVERLPVLESIIVQNSTISTLIPPERDNSIQELILKNLTIKRIQREFVLYFPLLKVLILEENLLSELNNHFAVGSLEELYVRHNRWNCTRDLSWALHLNETGVVRDLQNTTCKDKQYPEKSVLLVAEYKKNMMESCTETCECSLEYIASNPSGTSHNPIIMVNCSGRGFKELPSHFPPNTRILHLENNKISDIKALKTNSSFRPLWDLYLDNNTIESISYLEGSYWLSNFRRFSLKGNRMTKLPSYALDNALMKNPNMPKGVTLFLGSNPWKCDCVFTPVFQELVLQKYSSQIADLRDVKCSYIRGDENSLQPIIILSRSSICMVPSDFSLQEGLDLLNAILASLIVFILGKLAYDYYHFKKSGKLPWIVSKMP